MKRDATYNKKTKKNILFLTISQIVTIAFGLVMPRLILRAYGSEVNGLLNSIMQVISYLALFEAGIQNVAKQQLYKSIVNNDENETNSILSAVNKNYKKIGLFYFLFLIGLGVVYPLIAKCETVDFFGIFLIVVFSGLGNVVLFFVQGKYQILLTSDGKTYVLTVFGTIVSILSHSVKVAMLLLGCNIVLVIAITFAISLIQSVLVIIYVKHKYKWVDLKVDPKPDCLKQSKYALVHQISGQIFTHIDVILLTIFCGLKIVSVYSIYKMISNYLRTAIVIPLDSGSFALGQTFNKDREKYIRYLDSVDVLLTSLVFGVFSVMVLLAEPFVGLYTSGITDVNYIWLFLPFLFAICEALNIINAPSNSTVAFAGKFKETTLKTIIKTIINLTVSIVGVLLLGIYGVLLGTIAALAYSNIDFLFYSNKKILNRSPIKPLMIHMSNLLLFLLISAVSVFVKINVSSYLEFAKYGIVLTTIIVPFFILFSITIFKGERAMAVSIMKNFFNRK